MNTKNTNQQQFSSWLQLDSDSQAPEQCSARQLSPSRPKILGTRRESRQTALPDQPASTSQHKQTMLNMTAPRCNSLFSDSDSGLYSTHSSMAEQVIAHTRMASDKGN